MLLTKVFRMLIAWRKFNRSKRGTIRFQALVRGYNLRRELASAEVQRCYRRFIARKHFVQLKSAVLALQCRKRVRDAKRVMDELKKEQKDVGKLKGMNEKLKQEMASLRAMLAAQAKESAASDQHSKEIAQKQKEIDSLEKRIAQLEKELDDAKSLVTQLESDLAAQKKLSAQDQDKINHLQKRRTASVRNLEAPDSPRPHRRRPSTDAAGAMPNIPSDYISPDILAEHLARVAKLEEELENERQLRREADGEIIKMRAAVNGVRLDEEMVNDLLSPQVDNTKSEESSVVSDVPTPRYENIAITCICALSKLSCLLIVFPVALV